MLLVQLLVIAKNTFTEAIRQPIYTILLGLAFLVIGFTPSLSGYTMTHGEDTFMLMDQGLATVALATLLLAAFTATGVVSEEIERRTVLTVVSKPVARPVFILGKFLGVMAAIAIAYWMLSLFLLLVVRHGVLQTASDHLDGPVWGFTTLAILTALTVAATGNYLYRWVFTSTFVKLLPITLTAAFALVLVISKEGELQSPITEFVVYTRTSRVNPDVPLQVEAMSRYFHLSIGLILMFGAMVVLTATAVACSTRLGQVATILVMAAVFFVGLLTNSLSQLVNQWAGVSPTLGLFESIAAILAADLDTGLKALYGLIKLGYLVLPNLQLLWPADAISQENTISLYYFGLSGLYAGCQTVVILALAGSRFQRREVG